MQPELFVASAELNHPSLHGLDGGEAVLDWDKLEQLMDGIYGANTGRPSYPLLTLLRSLFWGYGTGWYVKKNSRGNLKSTYGYSVHTAVDEDGFIHRQTVTAGNVHDSQEHDTLLLGDASGPLPPINAGMALGGRALWDGRKT